MDSLSYLFLAATVLQAFGIIVIALGVVSIAFRMK